MLSVKTPDEVLALIAEEFASRPEKELVPLGEARERILYEEICAAEFVPGFNRSTVDGFAVRAADTFGCSDAMPRFPWESGRIGLWKQGAVSRCPPAVRCRRRPMPW